MKVTTDGVLFGAWISSIVNRQSSISGNRISAINEDDNHQSSIVNDRESDIGSHAIIENVKGKMNKSWSLSDSTEVNRLKVLDIGCGTGLLGLMVVQKNDVWVDAVEVDKEAAEQAKENVEASPWRERIRVVNEDILNFSAEYKYDVVVCNPPFYEKEIRSGKVAKDTAHHSEQLKLDQVFDVIGKHLRDDGVFYLLLPGKRENEMERLMRKKKMILKKKVILHLSETNKRLMIEGGRILNIEQGIVNEEAERIVNSEQGIVNEEVERGIVNGEVREEEIWVRDERFRELMKDYYLNL